MAKKSDQPRNKSNKSPKSRESAEPKEPQGSAAAGPAGAAASFGNLPPFDQQKEQWRVVIETNLSSVFYTCRAVCRPMMKKRAGSIVNVSSIVGVRGNWGQTNYAASKAGIIGFTKSLARELGSRNVRANVVAPGYVKTRLTDVLPEEATQAMLQSTPLGRLGEPADVAGAVRFLCSDAAAFITGEVLLVDGGLGM